MNEVLRNIDWTQVITTLWTVVLLPILTYIGSQVGEYVKAKKIDKYTDILYKNVVKAAKDVYETCVKDIKGSDAWDIEMQNRVKEIAKDKAITSLTNSMYEMLKVANSEFDDYLDSLVETALYDLKRAG